MGILKNFETFFSSCINNFYDIIDDSYSDKFNYAIFNKYFGLLNEEDYDLFHYINRCDTNNLSVSNYIVNEQRLSEFVKNNSIESGEIIDDIEKYFRKYKNKSLQTIPVTEQIPLKRFYELYEFILDVSEDFQLNYETEQEPDPEEEEFDGLILSFYFFVYNKAENK